MPKEVKDELHALICHCRVVFILYFFWLNGTAVQLVTFYGTRNETYSTFPACAIRLVVIKKAGEKLKPSRKN